MTVRKAILNAAVIAAAVGMMTGCFNRRKYENPITKQTQQPDKVLFDRAIKDLEKGRYEVARLTLNTLMNAYETSEFLAKAKLAIADSWYREGGAHNLAQAEAEYKDFILFYPAMEEAAESQVKICQIHYNQIEKADRDATHALRAEEECRAVILNYPNSKFRPEAEQLIRNIQENLAEGEYKVGRHYFQKGSYPAAANRLQNLALTYPLYSKADYALWEGAEAYRRMTDAFEKNQVQLLTKLVREYPLSALVDNAKARLKELGAQVPDADPVALARAQFEAENHDKIGMLSKFWGAFKASPNLSMAAKSGQPPMEAMRPSIPATVPPVAAGTQGTSADVTISIPGDPTALDTQPDARSVQPKPEQPAAAQPPAEPPQT